MCSLYSITTNQAAIAALFRVVNRYVGNLAPMPGVFPDYPAPSGRVAWRDWLPPDLRRTRYPTDPTWTVAHTKPREPSGSTGWLKRTGQVQQLTFLGFLWVPICRKDGRSDSFMRKARVVSVSIKLSLDPIRSRLLS
jgi:hypothetical protein